MEKDGKGMGGQSLLLHGHHIKDAGCGQVRKLKRLKFSGSSANDNQGLSTTLWHWEAILTQQQKMEPFLHMYMTHDSESWPFIQIAVIGAADTPLCGSPCLIVFEFYDTQLQQD